MVDKVAGGDIGECAVFRTMLGTIDGQATRDVQADTETVRLLESRHLYY